MAEGQSGPARRLACRRDDLRRPAGLARGQEEPRPLSQTAMRERARGALPSHQSVGWRGGRDLEDWITGHKLPLGWAVKQFIAWLQAHASWFFDLITQGISFMVDGL